ncbi:MAG: small ribosomal subunit Rsm22 family protein [Bacteriovoracia bacterium]
MKVSTKLENIFNKERSKGPLNLEEFFVQFVTQSGLVENARDVYSKRFLTRSIAPHIQKLSDLFVRKEGHTSEKDKMDPYWADTSNPKNQRLAYFLYYLPQTMFRMASIFEELWRFGFFFNGRNSLKVVEFGSGPASGSSSLLLMSKVLDLELPHKTNFALIDQDPGILKMGSTFMDALCSFLELPHFPVRAFKRSLDFSEPLLPGNAPEFDLMLMSYFLNESNLPPKQIASSIKKTIKKHLSSEGLFVLCEPALKEQSRKVLEVRKYLLDEVNVLLPCLGNQECGALRKREDWCHEEVSWWRPGYIKTLDEILGFDHKSLSFTYLVFTKKDYDKSHFLKGLSEFKKPSRIVSNILKTGNNVDFFTCDETGKNKKRKKADSFELKRGDLLERS